MGARKGEAPVLAMEEGSLDLPPGFRFYPTDEEIITHYLAEKAMNRNFTARAIGEVDLNRCEPWDLPSKAKMGEKEWYFFYQRDRKYPTGMRTNRATESGYWKATGKDREIYKGKNCLVGMKKTLVFYRGRAPKGEKTNWVMHEYRMEGKSSFSHLPKAAKDAWVVCRVFHKNTGPKKSPMPEPARIDSFGVKQSFEDEYLGSPFMLPHLASPYGSFTDDGGGGDFKTAPSTSSNPPYLPSSLSMEMLQDLQNSFLGSNMYPSTSHHQVNLYSPPEGRAFHPQAPLPSSSHMGLLHQERINPGIILHGYATPAGARAAPQGQEPAAAVGNRHCNVEQFSNQSMAISASQETGMSTDRNTEISSVVSKHAGGVGFSMSFDDVGCPSSAGLRASGLETLDWKY